MINNSIRGRRNLTQIGARYPLITLFIFIAGVFSAEGGDKYAPYELNEIIIDGVYAGVRDQLKDPDSAKFSDLKASITDNNAVSVCGFVNAKNSYGGYVGKQPFIGITFGDNKEKFYMIGMGGGDTHPEAIINVCKSSGINLAN